MTSGLGLTGLFVAAVNFHHFGVVCEAVVLVVEGCHHIVLLLVVVVVVVEGGGVDVTKVH